MEPAICKVYVWYSLHEPHTVPYDSQWSIYRTYTAEDVVHAVRQPSHQYLPGHISKVPKRPTTLPYPLSRTDDPP